MAGANQAGYKKGKMEGGGNYPRGTLPQREMEEDEGSLMEETVYVMVGPRHQPDFIKILLCLSVGHVWEATGAHRPQQWLKLQPCSRCHPGEQSLGSDLQLCGKGPLCSSKATASSGLCGMIFHLLPAPNIASFRPQDPSLGDKWSPAPGPGRQDRDKVLYCGWSSAH